MESRRSTPIDVEETAARIRAARAYADITQKELGRRTGFSKSTVERWEKADPGAIGRDRAKRYRLIFDVARATKLPSDWLIDDWAPDPIEELVSANYELKERVEELENRLGAQAPRPDEGAAGETLKAAAEAAQADQVRRREPPRKSKGNRA
jgi:transcriptional regulator with XRE-family HTH domain